MSKDKKTEKIVHGMKGKTNALKNGKHEMDDRLSARCYKSDKLRWKEAAGVKRVTYTDFVLQTLNEKADEVLGVEVDD